MCAPPLSYVYCVCVLGMMCVWIQIYLLHMFINMRQYFLRCPLGTAAKDDRQEYERRHCDEVRSECSKCDQSGGN